MNLLQQAAVAIARSQEGVLCPHCRHVLTEEQIRSIWGQFIRRLDRTGISRFAKMTPEQVSAEQRRIAERPRPGRRKSPAAKQVHGDRVILAGDIRQSEEQEKE